MINFNYNTNLYLVLVNYFGLKIYFLIPKCYFSITYIEWAHVFPYIYTFSCISLLNLYISVFVNYVVKKGYKLLNISLFVCLINVRTIMAVTVDLVA